MYWFSMAAIMNYHKLNGLRQASLVAQLLKESACNAGDLGSIRGLRQHSVLEFCRPEIQQGLSGLTLRCLSEISRENQLA